MVEVEIAEAQTQLIELLARVEQGEFVAIMKDGYAVACLTPTVSKARQDASRAASERMAERRKTLAGPPFTWEEIKADRDFGKR